MSNNPDLLFLSQSLDEICQNCESPDQCHDCLYNDMMKSVAALSSAQNDVVAQTEPCALCKKKKEIFYDDNRGGLAVALYCPNCGRKI